MHQDREGDFELPEGLHLPLSSNDDVSAIEASLDNKKFPQHLVLSSK